MVPGLQKYILSLYIDEDQGTILLLPILPRKGGWDSLGESREGPDVGARPWRGSLSSEHPTSLFLCYVFMNLPPTQWSPSHSPLKLPAAPSSHILYVLFPPRVSRPFFTWLHDSQLSFLSSSSQI